jgi:transposase-like protein
MSKEKKKQPIKKEEWCSFNGEISAPTKGRYRCPTCRKSLDPSYNDDLKIFYVAKHKIPKTQR